MTFAGSQSPSSRFVSSRSGIALVRLAALAALALVPGWESAAQSSFVNWETPHVSPLALTPDGSKLLAVNTADNRLLVFDVQGGAPTFLGSVPVGLDPVSVRARSDDEAWVVNHVSDSVSVVDLSQMNVIATLTTRDEPCDVVFAGAPQRAFVSCSQESYVLVFDPTNLAAGPLEVSVDGEDPRAMAVSADGTKVFVAFFESGNASTVLGGGALTMAGRVIGFPPNVVDEATSPHGGVNPPPNSGASFVPARNGANPTEPRVSLIVKRNASNQWMDDNGGDWTDFVTGANASLSGRIPGWTLPDNDVAVIDASSLAVSYATGLMNICMAMAVNPASGQIAVVGTEATNEIRFEPVLKGKFTRVEMARVDPSGPTRLGVVDLNSHLNYSSSTIAQTERDKSIGDPRGIVFDASGTRAYVTGLGSNNVVVIDANGARAGLAPTIEVGEGPTGVALHPTNGNLYVLNKFAGSISVVDTTTETETGRVPFFDPSPSAIKVGRKHVYDTHKNSGLGQLACGSCHVDARMDRLAWDLGDPAGDMKSISGQNMGMGVPGLSSGAQDWHPMKGPMTTQTLQDIIGREPLHWRGDRAGLEEFNGAFTGLQGDDVMLTPSEMQEFENFLATIYYQPNPHRNKFGTGGNTLSTSLPLPGHYTTGRFGPPGQPLPNGNAVNGLALYRSTSRLIDAGALACVTCHTLPTGMGTDMRFQGGQYVQRPIGPNGEHHHGMVAVDGVTNISMKIPQTRNVYDKTGFNTTITSNRAGFGFLHDGSVDSVERFVDEPVFDVRSDQETADITAFMISFAGSNLPQGNVFQILEPPGTASQDTHAAVGAQTTVVDGSNVPPAQTTLLNDMLSVSSQSSRVALVVKGRQGGIQRGYSYNAGATFQADRAGETIATAALIAAAAPGNELTWTLVPEGMETRVGIDQDLDGALDRDELDAGSDPADPTSTPEIGCRAGNINKRVGSPANVVFVNGSAGTGNERLVNITPTTPFTLSVVVAPSGGKKYAMYAWAGAPSAATWRRAPNGIGITCMPTPLNPGAPQPRRRANNLGSTAQLGTELWPGPPTQPAPYLLLNLPGGVGKTGTFFIQGIMRDNNSPNGVAGVTNGIVVVSQ